MNAAPEQLYLDLMKKTLTFALWDEPGIPIETLTHNYKRSLAKRVFANATAHALRSFNYQLVKRVRYDAKGRAEGTIWPMCADTMIGLKRLDNIQFCVESVLRNNIEGDLIETGVWRGGACIFMRAILAANNITNRRVLVADSFQGLPKPDTEKYPQDSAEEYHLIDFLSVSRDKVEARFRQYGLMDDQVVFLQGWFEETMPVAPVDKLAVMRLDGDMYSSTIVVLNNLYTKLSQGGYCIIDDYGLPTCKQAVDDYRTHWGIRNPLTRIDSSEAVFWQKEAG